MQHFNDLSTRVCKVHGVILQVAGVGLELAEAEKTRRQLREVETLLEDIMCTAMLSRKEAKNIYINGGFLFQNK